MLSGTPVLVVSPSCERTSRGRRVTLAKFGPCHMWGREPRQLFTPAPNRRFGGNQDLGCRSHSLAAPSLNTTPKCRTVTSAASHRSLCSGQNVSAATGSSHRVDHPPGPDLSSRHIGTRIKQVSSEGEARRKCDTPGTDFDYALAGSAMARRRRWTCRVMSLRGTANPNISKCTTYLRRMGRQTETSEIS